jgi:hypothetical protein
VCSSDLAQTAQLQKAQAKGDVDPALANLFHGVP